MQLEPYYVETFPSDYKNHYIHVLKFGNILGKTDMEKKKVIASVLGMYAIHPEAMSNLQGDLIVTRETHDETPEHTIQVVNFVMKRLNELLKLNLEPEKPPEKYLVLEVDDSEYTSKEGGRVNYAFPFGTLEAVLEYIKRDYKDYKKFSGGDMEIEDYINNFRLYKIKKDLKITAIENNIAFMEGMEW